MSDADADVDVDVHLLKSFFILRKSSTSTESYGCENALSFPWPLHTLHKHYPGEIEVKVAYNHEFGFDPDTDASDASDANASPTNRSFMCGGRWRWVLAAATLLCTAFAIFLGSASVLGIVAHRTQAQAAIKVSDNGSISKSGKRSKSGKSGSNTDAEEPDGDAVRAKFEGSVIGKLGLRLVTRSACKVPKMR